MLGSLTLFGRFVIRNSQITHIRYHKDKDVTKLMDNIIDFRSDTSTKPSQGMRDAMAKASVGDDVYGDDPTVNELEERCANLFQKEASLFVLSGTMGNLLSIMSHTQRGDEIIVALTSHIHRWEQTGYASIAGVSATTLPVNKNGLFVLKDLVTAIRDHDIHMPRTNLICLENTFNFVGGKVIPLDYVQKVRKICDDHHIAIHMDGARLYNAAVRSGLTLAKLSSASDSVMMCFSKGLGAPAGSIIVGSTDFIAKCRRYRKAIGGGWRQAGILAAGALYALDRAEETIKTDHENALYLGEYMRSVFTENSRHSVDVSTNMILLRSEFNARQLSAKLKENNVLVHALDNDHLRIVVHKDVSRNDIDRFVHILRSLIENST